MKPFAIFKLEEKRKRKEVEKNLPLFTDEYKELCKKYQICLEARLESREDGSFKPALVAIHIEDMKG